MSSDPPNKPQSLDDVYEEAYRTYLRSLRDGLANLDIDAIDLRNVRAPLPPGGALYSFGAALYSFSAPNAALYSFGETPREPSPEPKPQSEDEKPK